MIPNIFVSSTIQDLFHLREAIREAIEELSCNPVMSEYGDVGYLPSTTAVDSCYISIQNCQLVILIVGKRYGEITSNDLSVTHNEFMHAHDKKVPIISMVDKDVLTYKKVYDLNDKDVPQNGFPGMDNPHKTFAFIQAINDSEYNNGILPYSSSTDARIQFKKQLAHLFGELLRGRFEPIQSEIKDILSEIKTLKHELLKDRDEDESLAFLRATRFLLRQKNYNYRDLIERTLGSIERGVKHLVKANDFEEFIRSAGIKVKIKNELDIVKILRRKKKFIVFSQSEVDYNIQVDDENKLATVAIISHKDVLMNEISKRKFTLMHEELWKEIHR